MTLTLPPELEQQINSLIRRGEYPNTEAVLVDAVKALVREQERQRIESLLEANGIDEVRLMQLLQEAEDSSDYTEMTAQDWKAIDRTALPIVNPRKPGELPLYRVVTLLPGNQTLPHHLLCPYEK